jgi:hypothetical protein
MRGVKDLGEIERDKLRVARAYNKRIKKKSFQVEGFSHI